MATPPIAVRVTDLPVRVGTDYPAPHDVPCRQRRRQALGNVFGLSQFGVNQLELPPGTWSSQRHWHERQDELVYVLEGEVVLVTDDGETVLTAGMTAGFPAGKANGHHLVNRSDRATRVLEVGTRTVEEVGHYSDIDMMVREDASGWGYYTKDGRPLK
ncbi:cupin domain-containing protein [Reyranella sp.]|uniref:cupin domain-containing protein n=1 Tax=Reyranella sp. TaxID=1929291 RepID=UPI0037838782